MKKLHLHKLPVLLILSSVTLNVFSMIAPFTDSKDIYLSQLPKGLDNRIMILVEMNKLREKDPNENKENLLHSLIEN